MVCIFGKEKNGMH